MHWIYHFEHQSQNKKGQQKDQSSLDKRLGNEPLTLAVPTKWCPQLAAQLMVANRMNQPLLQAQYHAFMAKLVMIDSESPSGLLMKDCENDGCEPVFGSSWKHIFGYLYWFFSKKHPFLTIMYYYKSIQEQP